MFAKRGFGLAVFAHRALAEFAREAAQGQDLLGNAMVVSWEAVEEKKEGEEDKEEKAVRVVGPGRARDAAAPAGKKLKSAHEDTVEARSVPACHSRSTPWWHQAARAHVCGGTPAAAATRTA